MSLNVESSLDASNENIGVPKWVTPNYFNGILQEDFPDFEKISKFKARLATAAGENYASTLLRVSVDLVLKDGAVEHASYILKTSIEGLDNANKLLGNMNIFPKEKEIYEKILPQFEKLYAEAGKTVCFGPRSKFIDESPEKITLVMEDLKPKKFENVSRLCGFDMIHMEQALRKLAKFHAASAVHYERVGHYSKHFDESFFSEKNRPLIEILSKDKQTMYKSALLKWGDCDKYLSIWPNKAASLKWFLENQKPKPNEFAVLNHGDCWSNNIMFQYDKEGGINETYFVDFQMCRWGSPAQDLHYVIVTSASYDIRISGFDMFLKIYQENLAKNLKLLQYSKAIPSLMDIHILMLQNSPWGFFTATNILPIVLLDPNDNASMETFLSDDTFKSSSFMNPRYVKTMKQLLPWFENRGFFQFPQCEKV